MNKQEIKSYSPYDSHAPITTYLNQLISEGYWIDQVVSHPSYYTEGIVFTIVIHKEFTI